MYHIGQENASQKPIKCITEAKKMYQRGQENVSQTYLAHHSCFCCLPTSVFGYLSTWCQKAHYSSTHIDYSRRRRTEGFQLCQVVLEFKPFNAH